MSDAVIVIAIIVIVVGLVGGTIAFTVTMAGVARRARIDPGEGVVTSGVVVGHDRHPFGPAPHTSFVEVPTFRFTDERGSEQIGQDQLPDNGRIPIGTVMQIAYRPENPRRVRRLERTDQFGTA